MDKFELHSEYKPTGDQPQAIEKLVKGFKEGNQFQTLLGVTGSGKTYTLANVIAGLNKGVFICRLLPIVRTLVSLVSGALRIEFSVFLIYSAAGISIWNSIFILLGYFSAKTILG